jgi:hypothetical protein
MTLDASGRLGIGNTSPQVPLSVTSSGDNWGVFIGPNAGNTTGKRLKLGYFGTSDYAAIQSINDGTSVTSLVLQKDGGNVGIGTTSPAASSLLDVTSTTQGFLPPRMTTTQKNAIVSPAAGLIVYDTTLNKLCVRTAAAWETITSL